MFVKGALGVGLYPITAQFFSFQIWFRLPSISFLDWLLHNICTLWYSHSVRFCIKKTQCSLLCMERVDHCNLNRWVKSGIILVIGSTNERRCYNVMSSFIGWAHAHNDHCKWFTTVFLESNAVVMKIKVKVYVILVHAVWEYNTIW